MGKYFKVILFISFSGLLFIASADNEKKTS